MPYRVRKGLKGLIFSRLMASVRLRVTELRKRRGWSQEELAKRAGVRRATIHALERGASPRLDTLAKLAVAFGVKVAALLRED